MKKLTKRAARLASIGLCAAMLLTACGGNTNSGSGATGETGSTSTSTEGGGVSAPTGGGDGVLDPLPTGRQPRRALHEPDVRIACGC